MGRTAQAARATEAAGTAEAAEEAEATEAAAAEGAAWEAKVTREVARAEVVRRVGVGRVAEARALVGRVVDAREVALMEEEVVWDLVEGPRVMVVQEEVLVIGVERGSMRCGTPLEATKAAPVARAMVVVVRAKA